MSLNINMTTAIAGTTPETTLASVVNLIDRISTEASAHDKILNYLECLSQTMSLEGIYRGKCESTLKAKLYALATEHRVITHTIIKEEWVTEDSRLSSTIKKLNYLSAGVFGYRNNVTNYVAKTVHHLKMTYAENKSYGAAYLTSGAALLLSTGLAMVFPENPTASDKTIRINTGIAAIALGAALILTPIINSFISAAKNEP